MNPATPLTILTLVALTACGNTETATGPKTYDAGETAVTNGVTTHIDKTETLTIDGETWNAHTITATNKTKQPTKIDNLGTTCGPEKELADWKADSTIGPDELLDAGKTHTGILYTAPLACKTGYLMVRIGEVETFTRLS